MTLHADTQAQPVQPDTPAERVACDAEAPEAQRSARRRRWLERLAAAGFAVALFFATLWLYTRHNDFPSIYHADEGGKARQVVEGGRNYNHPQLLLEATYWAVRWFETPGETQATVEVGRWCSAVFAAMGAVAAAWIGYAAGGLLGMILVGCIVGLSPQVLTYAHYMKEDAALVFGLVVTLLGTRVVWEARRWWTRILAWTLLGTGVALAASGKYAGLLAFALTPVVLVAPRVRWYVRPAALLWTLATAVGLILLINHRTLNDWETFREELAAYRAAEPETPWTLQEHAQALGRVVFHDRSRGGFGREADHAVTAHSGLTMARPNTFFLCLFPVEVMPHALVLAGGYVLVVAGSVVWRRRGWWGVWLIGFAGLYLGALSMSVIPFHRYFLPVSVMTYLAGGLGLVWVVEAAPRGMVWLRKRGWRLPGVTPEREGAMRVMLAVAAAAGVVAVQGARCFNYLDQFAHDSRAALREWVVANVPKDARILVEDYTDLTPQPRLPPGHNAPTLPQRVLRERFAPDAGPIDRLISRRRVDYVVICDVAYARFHYPQVQAVKGEEAKLSMRRAWYAELDRDHELVWSRIPRPNMHAFTNPEIRVYRLRK